MSFYPIKPLLAYGGNSNILYTGKTLWERKPVGLKVSQVGCQTVRYFLKRVCKRVQKLLRFTKKYFKLP